MDPKNNNTKTIFSHTRLKVLEQIDNFSCGYHALKNALLLLKKEEEKYFTDTSYFWQFFHCCTSILHHVPQLPDKDLISDGVLEASYANALLVHHPDLHRYESSGELSLFPTLACLESGLLCDDDVASLVPRIRRFTDSVEARHVWVISSSANHWVALLAAKRTNGEVHFALADPAMTERAIHPDVLNLMRCLRGDLSFEAMYLEAVVRGIVKEFQEVAAKCYTCSSDQMIEMTNEYTVTVRQLFAQLAESIQTRYSLSVPCDGIDSRLADLDRFILVQRQKSMHSFDASVKESFLRFKTNLQVNINWNQNSTQPWPFLEEGTFGDAIAARNSSSKLELSLWNYQLPSLPNLVNSLTSLRVLNLNQNSMVSIPESLFLLPHLELLSICSNKLVQLPEISKANSSLRELMLSNNLIETLPISIVNFVNLRSLHLDGNRLQKIDTLPGSLSALVLSYNRLKETPALDMLQKLEVLLLDNNQLESIQLPNRYTKTLQVLWVQNNPLTDSVSAEATGYSRR